MKSILYHFEIMHNGDNLVWQKSHLERTLQMAEILTSPGIPGRTFRPILSKLSFHLLLK